MGIQPHQYKKVAMLKKRVVEVAINEINAKTDIVVSYNFQRTGRTISDIHFTIRSKNQALSLDEQQQAIRKKLEGFGLQNEQIEALLKRHDEEYLWANIAIVEEQYHKGKIKNVTAYLLKGFEVDYRPTETDLEKAQQEAETKRQQAQEQAAKEAEAKDVAKLQFFAERRQLVEAHLAQLPKEEAEQLKQDFIASKSANHLYEKMIQSKGLSHPMIEAQRHQHIAEQFLEDRYKGFEAYWESRAV